MDPKAFILLALFFICHFLADFTALSTKWMLNAKQFGKPLYPILVHASVHALLMGLVTLFFSEFSIAWRLFGIQVILHFGIDTLKGRMNGWFPIVQDQTKRPYWVLLGFDQLLHGLSILFMVYYFYYLG